MILQPKTMIRKHYRIGQYIFVIIFRYLYFVVFSTWREISNKKDNSSLTRKRNLCHQRRELTWTKRRQYVNLVMWLIVSLFYQICLTDQVASLQESLEHYKHRVRQWSYLIYYNNNFIQISSVKSQSEQHAKEKQRLLETFSRCQQDLETTVCL